MINILNQKIFIFFIFLMSLLFLNESIAKTKLKGKVIAGGIVVVEASPNVIFKLDGNIIPVSKEGYAIIGFERQPKNLQILEIIYKDAVIEKISLEVIQRSYTIQKIDGVEKEKVEPPQELLDRIYQERSRVKKARRKAGFIQESYYMNGFIWPAVGIFSGIYGSQRILNGIPKSPHYGLDIALPEGHDVLSPMDGIVLFTDNDLYYSGGTILIGHGQGLTTSYLHLSKIIVKEGQKILKGGLIGKVGSTGRATGPHLHWGVEWMGKRLDPEYLVEALR